MVFLGPAKMDGYRKLMVFLSNWLAWSRLRQKVAILCQTKQIFTGRSSGFGQKKSAKYGGKWAFMGQTACHLTSYIF